MALLIVEHDGRVNAGILSDRILIGRRPDAQIRLADKTVAPLHAWISQGVDGTYVVSDAGSKAGTFVNDERVVGCRTVSFGDRIRLGPLLLKLTDGQIIPAGARALDLRRRPSPVPSPSSGIAFDCVCEAPMWVPWSAAGKSGKCRSCGATISVPMPVERVTTVAHPSSATDPRCGVCHGAIEPAEKTTNCPSCGTLFHEECWTENGGCSVYGCSQVNILQPPPTPNESAVEPNGVSSGLPLRGEEDAIPATMPWAYALLAASVLGAVAGSLTFGGTSLLAAIGAVYFLLRTRPKRQRNIVFLSIAVSFVGTVAGVFVSGYLWMNGSTWLPRR